MIMSLAFKCNIDSPRNECVFLLFHSTKYLSNLLILFNFCNVFQIYKDSMRISFAHYVKVKSHQQKEKERIETLIL